MSWLQAGWVWWLATPALVTVAAALGTWWVGRPPRPLTSSQSIRQHRAFLSTLEDRTARMARGVDAPTPTESG